MQTAVCDCIFMTIDPPFLSEGITYSGPTLPGGPGGPWPPQFLAK